MKRFVTIWLMALILASLVVGGKAHASLFDGKYSAAQVFDVQRNGCYAVGGPCSVGNMITPFIAPYTNWTHVNFAPGDYVMFYDNGASSNNIGMKQYAADGTYKGIISSSGYIVAIGSGIVYIGVPNMGGGTGYFVSNDQGYAYGSSATVRVDYVNPSMAQLNSYTASTTPLAAGQTAGPAPAPAAPPFDGTITQTNPSGSTTSSDSGSSTITTSQQTRITTWANRVITQTGIWIDQVGDNNSVTIDQAGVGLVKATIRGSASAITVNQGSSTIGQNETDLRLTGDNNTVTVNQARASNGTMQGTNGHYQTVDINGFQNTVQTTQNNTGGVGGHYAETTISGNQNNITEKQTDNGNKIMFTSVNGNNNSVDVTQRGTGQHYLDLKLTGNGNGALITQEGTTGNKATVDLTNAGGAATLDLQQSGGKTFSIQQSCVTASGCSTTVRQ